MKKSCKKSSVAATRSAPTPGHTPISGRCPSTVRSQMERTANKVKEVTGVEMTIMRPPYGANNRLSRRVLKNMGLPIILWSVIPWTGRPSTPPPRSRTSWRRPRTARLSCAMTCGSHWPRDGGSDPKLIEKASVGDGVGDDELPPGAHERGHRVQPWTAARWSQG